jgi:hypothetical protein
MFVFTVTLLNIHDDERQKPENWIPVGWLPIYDDKKTKGLRPGRGYETTSVTRLENIACITNAGMSFWETGPRKLVQHVTSHGRAVNDARRGFLLEACWGINR